ncbi:uncharacterized protein LOC144051705 isoform X1 [Vanacampus margaritifer]
MAVQKSTAAGKSGLRSTLYQAHSGPFPDPDFMAAGDKLRKEEPQPLIALVLDHLSDIDLVPSRFGPVPRKCPISYLCPPKTSGDLILHHLAPEFPALPLPRSRHLVSNLDFVPTLRQQSYLESLKVSPQMASEIEKGTRQQSKCPAWALLRQPRLTDGRFREACASSGQWREDPEAAAKTLAIQMINGPSNKTAAMRRKLSVQMKSEVLASYANLKRVNVLAIGFVIPPEAPHLGASSDGRVYDPGESPPFGLVEAKSTTKPDASQVGYLKMENGNVTLRRSHRYYWQVQGQLAVTGLRWCDFVTDTQEILYVERIWRDDAFIRKMKDKLDIFYYIAYMNEYLKSH